MYEILYKGIEDDLKTLSAYNRKKILDKIEKQLTTDPGTKTRNKKTIEGIRIPWELEAPLWELRVGEFRVFYEIIEERKQVLIHGVRHKPPHKTTEEIL